MTDFKKKIEIDTSSPDIGLRKITTMDDYYEKIAWWNSLEGEQQQEWLKIFISNTQFIPIPKITRSSLKNKNFKNEDLPKLYEISPPVLERSQKIGFEPSPYFDNATNEFINNKIKETKEHMNDCNHNLQVVDDILNKPDYLEIHGNEIIQKSSKL